MESAQRPKRLLRLQRQLRGWSQEDVAAGLRRLAAGAGEPGLGADATMVSRWERGARRPRARYVRLLSHLFEVPAEQLGLRGDEDADSDPAPAQPRGGALRDDEGARRALIGDMASLLGVAALPPGLRSAGSEPWERLSDAMRQRTRLDAATVAHLASIVVALEHLEPTHVGSLALIGPVTGHLDMLSLLLQGSLPAGLRGPVCSIAAETAGFAGWLHWNIGDPQRASAYFRTALRAAREAGDRALGIALAASAACQSAPQEDPRARIERLQGTSDFRPADATPSNGVWMAAKRAEAYAVMGRSDDSLRALDRAAVMLGDVVREGEERRPRFMVLDATWLAGEQGASLAKLGRTEEARSLLLPVLASLGPSSERDRIWLTLALATTYLKDGEPEEAARLGRSACAAASRISLQPVIDLVRELRDELRTIDQSPAVQELDEDVRLAVTNGW